MCLTETTTHSQTLEAKVQSKLTMASKMFYTVVLIFGFLFTDYVSAILKCCPDGEKLELANYTCVPDQRNQDLPLKANISSLVNGVGIPPCPIPFSDIIYLEEITPEDQFILMSNGSLVEFHYADPFRSFPPVTYCLDSSPNGLLAILCPCLLFECINKCCHHGHVISLEDGECIPSAEDYESEISFSASLEEFNATSLYVLKNQFEEDMCTEGMYTASQDDDVFEINEHGEAIMSTKTLSSDRYCFDIAISENGTKYRELLICFDNSMEVMVQNTLYSVVLIIGCIFLFISFMVYVLIPELRRNMHGKHFVCHSGSLLVAFIATTIRRLSSELVRDACRVLGK